MTEQLYQEITEWQENTFPESTEESRVNHLMKEIEELKLEVVTYKDTTSKRMEYADCFFLLFGAAAKAGYTYHEICEAIEEKFKINKKRTWGKPDKNGVVEHIRTKHF